MSALRDLRQLVLEERLLEPEVLADAVRAAAAARLPLAEHLVRSGLISDDQLLHILRRRLGLPITDLAQLAPEAEALRLVPQEVAERCRVLPLALFDRGARRVLRLAVIDPLDVATLDEVARTAGCSVELVVAAPTRVAAAIERCYRDLVTKVIPRRRSQPPGELSTDEAAAAEDAASAPRFVEVPTRPMHNIPSEAHLSDRLDALVTLLVRNGVLSEEDYADEVRRLLRARRGH